ITFLYFCIAVRVAALSRSLHVALPILRRRGGRLLRLRGLLLGRGRVRLLPGVMWRAESRLLRGLVGRRGRLGHDGNTSVKGTGDGEVTGRSEGAGRPGPALLTAVTRLTCRRRAST